MKCDQCEALTINGVFCHETGCPNSKKQWYVNGWFDVYHCPECGTDYFEDGAAAECCAPVEPQFREAKMMLFLSDSRGIYIPRDFATDIKRECLSGVIMADLDYLARGPHDIKETHNEPAHDAEAYWDVWQTVCDNAIVTDTDGTEYTLYQDGDLWLVEQGAESNEWNGGIDCMFVVRL